MKNIRVLSDYQRGSKQFHEQYKLKCQQFPDLLEAWTHTHCFNGASQKYREGFEDAKAILHPGQKKLQLPNEI
jgi:hypothetical protein